MVVCEFRSSAAVGSSGSLRHGDDGNGGDVEVGNDDDDDDSGSTDRSGSKLTWARMAAAASWLGTMLGSADNEILLNVGLGLEERWKDEWMVGLKMWWDCTLRWDEPVRKLGSWDAANWE